MIIVLIIAFILVYLVGNCGSGFSASPQGGAVHHFSPYFAQLKPSIDPDKLVYNNNPLKENEMEKRDIVNQFKRWSQNQPVYNRFNFTNEADEMLKNFPRLPESLVTITGNISAAIIFYATYNFSQLHERYIIHNMCLRQYFKDLMNNIDYKNTSQEVVKNLFRQVDNVHKLVMEEVKTGNYCPLDQIFPALPTSPAKPTSASLIEALRTDFYAIYKSDIKHFKNKGLKKKAYKKLLLRCEEIYEQLPIVGATEIQQSMVYTLIKRLRSLIGQ